MCVEESAQCRRRDGGHVAVSDEHVAGEVRGQLAEGASNGVAGAALRLLERESRVREVYRGFDLARLVPDDDYDWIGLERGDGADRARDHRFSAEFVQDLGALRAHPGPFAGGKDDGGDAHYVFALFVVIEVRDFPRVGVLARRYQPVAIEGAAFGHVDGRAKQEFDMVGGVALGGQLVVHDGLARVGVDFLSCR